MSRSNAKKLRPSFRRDIKFKTLHATLLTGACVIISSCQSGALALNSTDPVSLLILQDHFERNESQELKDEVGNGWFTNKGLANGRKQFDLQNGVVKVTRHKEARHGPGMAWKIDYLDTNGHQRNGVKNAIATIRFKVLKGNFSLSWGDRTAKGIRHNNISGVRINSRRIEIIDMKTGESNLENYAAIESNQVTPELQSLLDSTSVKFPYKLKFNEWHHLELTSIGDKLSVKLNNEFIGSLTSPGIAHENKQLIRVLGERNYVVDDVYVYTLDPPL